MIYLSYVLVGTPMGYVTRGLIRIPPGGETGVLLIKDPSSDSALLYFEFVSRCRFAAGTSGSRCLSTASICWTSPTGCSPSPRWTCWRSRETCRSPTSTSEDTTTDKHHACGSIIGRLCVGGGFESEVSLKKSKDWLTRCWSTDWPSDQ